MEKSLFGKLAAELRTQIWEYVLLHDRPIGTTTLP